jgi:hypothetical protein
MATGSPVAPYGSFTVNVTIPNDATPGDTFITATQMEADGSTAVAGTPARAAFTVLAPAPTPVVTTPTNTGPPAPPVSPAAPAPAAATPPASNVLTATTVNPELSAKLKAAIATCNKKYNVKKAKTRRAKHLMSQRRAICIAHAHTAATAASVDIRSLGAALLGGSATPGAIGSLL